MKMTIKVHSYCDLKGKIEMTSSERFKIVMDILDSNDLSNCPRNHTMFDALKPEELADETKVNEMIQTIRDYESRVDNNTNRYPEEIMAVLRQRRGLSPYDTSKDNVINAYTPDAAFSNVCEWEGLLGGYDWTIKKWIKSIYGVDL